MKQIYELNDRVKIATDASPAQRVLKEAQADRAIGTVIKQNLANEDGYLVRFVGYGEGYLDAWELVESSDPDAGSATVASQQDGAGGAEADAYAPTTWVYPTPYEALVFHILNAKVAVLPQSTWNNDWTPAQTVNELTFEVQRLRAALERIAEHADIDGASHIAKQLRALSGDGDPEALANQGAGGADADIRESVAVINKMTNPQVVQMNIDWITQVMGESPIATALVLGDLLELFENAATKLQANQGAGAGE